MKAGQAVDEVHGQRARQRNRQRSVHNTCFTLPVLVAMLSNHYGWLYQGKTNWLVLVLLMLIGALIRHSFVLRHQALVHGRRVPPGNLPPLAQPVLVRLVVWGMPQQHLAPPAPAMVSLAEVKAVLDQHCALCQNAQVQQEKRGAAHAATHQATRSGRVPAGGRPQADAAEQRDPDQRRRAGADQKLVRGRRGGELIPAWRGIPPAFAAQ